ncbi:MAG TPA: HAD hydrolase family protein [Polyangiaceae bacterium]|nr:HAD hydrolase family protein [Polyangiaceae bacterium]
MNRDAPRLLAVDLDGTLLDSRGQPHDRDVRALRAAIDAGIHVSLITGRLYSGTRPTCERVGLRGAVGCADGSHLVHSRNHATLLHLGMPQPHAFAIREALARAGVTTFVFAEDAIGHDASGTPFVGYISTWSTDIRVVPDVFQHELWGAPQGVTAVIAVGTRDRIAVGARDLSGELRTSLFVVTFPVRRGAHSDTWAMIVRASGGTKGTALRWIAEHESVALSDTVCVGDWVNDVPMFEVAGRSFVMGQAPDEVKSRATDVLAETAETGGGVERAVREAFGIRVPG